MIRVLFVFYCFFLFILEKLIVCYCNFKMFVCLFLDCIFLIIKKNLILFCFKVKLICIVINGLFIVDENL